MKESDRDIWYWYHNASECYYHIQITVKYRKSLLDEAVQLVIKSTISDYQERYAIEISEIGFDQNHLHLLCRFLPKYSGGQVIRLLKSTTARAVFKFLPHIKKELWGGEFWTDGYYIRNQGRAKDIAQLKLFDI